MKIYSVTEERQKVINGNSISYVYSALGDRLLVMEYIADGSPSLTNDEGWSVSSLDLGSLHLTACIGNFILSKPTIQTGFQVNRYLFDGGYVSAWGGYVSHNVFRPYTSHFHYYCRDHFGNNRVVVGEDGEIEQVTHYYPYGGLLGDVNASPDYQPYKSF